MINFLCIFSSQYHISVKFKFSVYKINALKIQIIFFLYFDIKIIKLITSWFKSTSEVFQDRKILHKIKIWREYKPNKTKSNQLRLNFA